MNKLLIGVVLLFAITACDKKIQIVSDKPEPKNTSEATPTLTSSSSINSTSPDVGKIEFVSVTAKGAGKTLGTALNHALESAIQQVNGVNIASVSGTRKISAYVEATIDVATANETERTNVVGVMNGEAFAKKIVAQSNGSIASFKVIKISDPWKKDGEYNVEIEAQVAKFQAPKSAAMIKVVVAPIRSTQNQFNIGGARVTSNEVLNSLHQQIVDALAQTGRFTILNRDFDSAIEQELSMIASGETTSTNFAKLGQALSADLVLMISLNEFHYDKTVRQLRTSDRELVSYSGGWSVSQKLVNLTTRQILQSSSLQGKAPSTEPTSYGSAVNSNAVAQLMQADISKKFTQAIVLRTFPISIVELDGHNAVLSQGGNSVAEKSRYQVFLLGKEITDPQTGQSLGNLESFCCDVLINRVTPNLSYGTLENIQLKLDGVQPGKLQLRDLVTAKINTVIEQGSNKSSKTSALKKLPDQASEMTLTESKPKKDDW